MGQVGAAGCLRKRVSQRAWHRVWACVREFGGGLTEAGLCSGLGAAEEVGEVTFFMQVFNRSDEGGRLYVGRLKL